MTGLTAKRSRGHPYVATVSLRVQNLINAAFKCISDGRESVFGRRQCGIGGCTGHCLRTRLDERDDDLLQ